MKLQMTLITAEAPRRELLGATCVTCPPGAMDTKDDTEVARHLTTFPGHVVVLDRRVTEMHMIGTQVSGGHVDIDMPEGPEGEAR